MKSLNQYILEKIQELPHGVRGLVVFDIDDTLLQCDPESIHVYKKDPVTGKETALSTAEFAVDPDAHDHKDWFDYREDNGQLRDLQINERWQVKNKLLNQYRII